MRVRTDDEIYRIDAVWLGPPRATFPWRATYASYLLGFLIFLVVLFVQRRLGIAFGIFPTAWALVITVFLTRVISRKVNYEKGVVHLFEHFWAEVTGPRAGTAHRRASVRNNHVRVHAHPAAAAARRDRGGSVRTVARPVSPAGRTTVSSSSSRSSRGGPTRVPAVGERGRSGRGGG